MLDPSEPSGFLSADSALSPRAFHRFHSFHYARGEAISLPAPHLRRKAAAPRERGMGGIGGMQGPPRRNERAGRGHGTLAGENAPAEVRAACDGGAPRGNAAGVAGRAGFGYRPVIAEQAMRDAARQRSPAGEHRRPPGRGMRAASSRRRGGRTAPADRGQPASRAALDFDFLRSAAEEPAVIAQRITQWVAFEPQKGGRARALGGLGRCLRIRGRERDS